MAARPVLLALVWHMHQPSYRDPIAKTTLLPWSRLHATKDYRDMVEILRAFPRVHCTFNLTPALFDQLERIAEGESDEWLELARAAASSLTPSQRERLLRLFFSVNRERMLDPRPRYRELWERAEASRAEGRAGADWSDEELRDLQVWFHLAWVDPGYAGEEPVRSLLAKGRGFTEEEKRALLDWGVALCGTVAGAYRTAAAAGQVELATSAHQHPILPLLVDSDAPREASPTISLPSPPFRAPDDAVAQVRRARDSHARRFGAPPRGTWPPEGAVCDRTVAILAGEGFAWAASDESVLASALRARDGGLNAWPAALYRAYAAATPSGPLAMLFRDRRLSDAIGFVYKHWDAARAAEDFLDRVRRAGETATGGGPALVTVILDGENCWEAYSEDGRPFLTALYGALEKNSAIEAVTVSEALRRAPPVERLPRVPVGSWIRDDLAIWIGHPEKNRAWTELRRAREALVERGLAAPPEAWEALYAAEASDWFWWYGDDHESSHKDSFDTLFRANVRSVYGLLGVAEPASLAASLRAARDTPRAPGEVAFLKPTIDGRETDFFEWRNAARYDAAASGGAAHPVAGAMARVLHGIDERSLFVRIDPASGAELGGASVAIRFADSGRAARVPIDGRESGHPEWAGQGVGEEGGGDAGAYARGVVVEARLPLSRCGAAPGAVLRWRVVLSRGGAVEETAPRDGWFETAIPPDDLRLRLWSAT